MEFTVLGFEEVLTSQNFILGPTENLYWGGEENISFLTMTGEVACWKMRPVASLCLAWWPSRRLLTDLGCPNCLGKYSPSHVIPQSQFYCLKRHETSWTFMWLNSSDVSLAWQIRPKLPSVKWKICFTIREREVILSCFVESIKHHEKLSNSNSKQQSKPINHLFDPWPHVMIRPRKLGLNSWMRNTVLETVKLHLFFTS